MITVQKKDFIELFNIACDNWKIKFLNKFTNNLFINETLDFDESFLEEMEAACNTQQQKKLFSQIFKEYKKNDLFAITNISEVCKKLNITELKKKDFSLFGNLATKMLAYWQIKQLELLFNGTWIADWSNSNQYKYYPIFNKVAGGWVFSGSVSHHSTCYGAVGFYKDEKTSDYIGKNFIEIYKNLL